MSLEGSTPSPSARLWHMRDWSSGTTPGFQPGDRGSIPRSRFGDRQDKASLAERPGTGFPGPTGGFDSRGASQLGNRLTGRLPDFESGGGGSNPSSRIDPAITASLAERPGTGFPGRQAGSTPAGRSRLGNRLTGRLPDFESGGGGLRNPSSRTWLGRQLADHSRLKRGMLRVRIPPEPFVGSNPVTEA